MAENVRQIVMPGRKVAILTKWRIKPGSNICIDKVLAVYKIPGVDGEHRLKSDTSGTVTHLCVDVGENVKPGEKLLVVEGGCSHSVVMKDMCAECGADLRSRETDKQEDESHASVSMVHCVPELVVNKEQAMELGKEDENRLLSSRKLVLLVDLDQTLIHTTNENIPPNLKDVYHFQLNHGQASWWYHTKFRPKTEEFLEAISKLYELHICTFGVRSYAHTIARFLDPEGKYFSHRILSREECFDPTTKTANLSALFPCGDNMACIIDDREDVWSFAPNMVHVKPYKFFSGTGDINAPPGSKSYGASSEGIYTCSTSQQSVSRWSLVGRAWSYCSTQGVHNKSRLENKKKAVKHMTDMEQEMKRAEEQIRQRKEEKEGLSVRKSTIVTPDPSTPNHTPHALLQPDLDCRANDSCMQTLRLYQLLD